MNKTHKACNALQLITKIVISKFCMHIICTCFHCSIWKYLYKLTNTYNTTIIITTHYIEEVRNSKMVGIMRKGTLLVEDDPISLMKQHSATLLEEVVLKICRLDRHNRRKSYEIDAQAFESVNVSKSNNKLCKCFHHEKSSKIKSEHVNFCLRIALLQICH